MVCTPQISHLSPFPSSQNTSLEDKKYKTNHNPKARNHTRAFTTTEVHKKETRRVGNHINRLNPFPELLIKASFSLCKLDYFEKTLL